MRLRRAALLAVVGVTVPVLSVAVAAPAAAAGLCADPGGSGAGGTLTGVVNTYYPGVGTAASGATVLDVGAAAGAAQPIVDGDLLLVVQTQGADFDSSNTSAYGDGVSGGSASGYTDLNQSGAYEYVRATSAVSAGSVSISGLGPGAGLLNSYVSAPADATHGQRTFQVIRVPQYTTATTSSGLTAAPWDGAVGGVLAVDTTDTLTVNGNVTVDGLGFRGGAGIRRGGASGLANTDVVTSATLAANGNKAEGVAGTPLGSSAGDGYPGGDAARGAPANAGGGGTDGRPSNNDQNSGGGGGGNGGDGGDGGNTWSSDLGRGGYGGSGLPADAGHVFLGGGGGAGTANNYGPPAADGAPGGGLVFFRASAVSGGGTVSARGGSAYDDTLNDGGGGGGAGGTVVITTTTGSLGGITIDVSGGQGGDAWATQAGAGNAHGPGGGGGGGWVLISSAPAAAIIVGGGGGVTTTGDLTYGSTDGADGHSAVVQAEDIPGVSGGAECADLSVTKSGPATVAAGEVITYQLAVENAGPADASGVSVTDDLPSGVSYVSATGSGWSCTHSVSTVTCTRPSLAVGAAPLIEVTVRAPAEPTTLTNDVAATATTPDPRPGNNTDSLDTAVTASADLSMAKTGPAEVVAGGKATYTLVASNAGPSRAHDVSVTDLLPAGVTYVSASGKGWSCVNAANTSVTCTRPGLASGAAAPPIKVTLRAPSRQATLVDSADVSSTTPDPRPSNNADQAKTRVRASADLSIAKSGPGSVTAGADLSYSVVVTNHGPDAARKVQVLDTLPHGTTYVSATGQGWDCHLSTLDRVLCTRAKLASGASAPAVTLVLRAPVVAGSITNRAEVSSKTDDPVPGNDAATAVTAVESSSTAGPLPGTGGHGFGLAVFAIALMMSGVALRIDWTRP